MHYTGMAAMRYARSGRRKLF
ncbi:MAG TPA: hypothetical protein VKT99_22995 [Xanthobacteraceae bacterium]|nr:hypothetical protein [Xanthobacteraceae bacterium]